jgi:hypothetical protein
MCPVDRQLQPPIGWPRQCRAGVKARSRITRSRLLSGSLEQPLELTWSLTARDGKRRVAVCASDIDTRTGGEQAPDHWQITTQRRDEKRCAAAGVGLLGADSTAQELIHPCEVPGLRRHPCEVPGLRRYDQR